jgi:Flp pilus assembly protein TadB
LIDERDFRFPRITFSGSCPGCAGVDFSALGEPTVDQKPIPMMSKRGAPSQSEFSINRAVFTRDDRMRQAHSYPSRYAKAVRRPTPLGAWPDDAQAGRHRATNPLIALVVAIFSIAWFVLTLPFRLVIGVISLLGRMTGVVVGFSLMALGMAFCAGPFFLIGVPMFLIGLLLTLRCLG